MDLQKKYNATDFEFAKANLLASPLLFTQVFFKVKTGKEFQISKPFSRESHFVTIFKALLKVYDGQTKRLLINVAPRYGKTVSLIYFIAWTIANNPKSNFLYISYSKSLAKLQTQTIREIIMLPDYRRYFGVSISEETSAKDDFHTSFGGSVFAAGAGGSITGRGAGVKNARDFSGAIVIDDIHKPIEVTSDTMRQSIIDWYSNTLLSRTNDKDTPIIFIGQRLHEDDLPSYLIKSGDWEIVSLKSLTDQSQALYPEMHDMPTLLKMQEENPYVFSSQYQQDPLPAGGGIFKEHWFVLHEIEPEIVSTFITADTAETSKTYNDATAFSFFGLYKLKFKEQETDLYGLHWLDCREIRVEPKDLESEFFDFYRNCMSYHVKPHIAAIEKKSTGVTLLSTLKSLQGIRIVEIDHTKAQGSKIDRFLQIQSYVASKRISLPTEGKHTRVCVEHCRKITANATHRFDDICDTLEMAITLGLRDNVVLPKQTKDDDFLKQLATHDAKIRELKDRRRWQR